jgi:hypothetical protein
MVIRIIYDLQTKEVLSILDGADGVTAYNQNTCGLIQSNEVEMLSQAIAFGLEAQPILDFIDSHNLNEMHPELRKVMKDRAFGQKLLNEFLAENKTIDLTLEQDLQIFQSLSPLVSMLTIGAINRAAELWDQVPADGVIITQARKDKYTNMLMEYLGDEYGID